MQSELEFKVREEDGSVGVGQPRLQDKDDRKWQAAQQRSGTKQQPAFQDILGLDEQVVGISEGAQQWAGDAPALTHQQQINAALLPSPPAASLDSSAPLLEPHHERHDAIDLGAPVVDETTPLLTKQPSSSGGLSDVASTSMASPRISSSVHINTQQGDPIPAAIDVPERVGEEAGAAIETAVEKCKEQVLKAKSLYSLWKEGEKQGLDGGAAAPAQDAEVTARGQAIWQAGHADDGSTSSTKIWAEGESGTAAKPGMMDTMRGKLASAQHALAPKIDELTQQAKAVYEDKVLPQIQAVGAAYHEQVEPQINKLSASVSSQVGEMQEDGWSETASKLRSRLAPKLADASSSIRSAYEDKVSVEQREQIHSTKARVMQQLRGGWDKIMDVWHGEEPIVREYADRGLKLVQRYKMELPLLFLATLMVLWASVAFFSWLAIPARPVGETLPSLYNPQWHASTGPIQGADLPSFTDKIKMKIAQSDDMLRDSFGKIHMPHLHSAAAGSAGIAGDVSLNPEDHIVEFKEHGQIEERLDFGNGQTIPSSSTPSVSARAGDMLHSLGDKMADLKDGMADRVQDHLHHVKDAMPSIHMPHMHMPSMHAAAGSAPIAGDISLNPEDHVVEFKEHGQIEERLDLGNGQTMPASSTPSATARAGSLLHSLGDKVQDRLHHVQDAVHDIKARVADSFTSHPAASQAQGTANLDVLNPDDHVIEFKQHGHIEERIQL